MNTVKIGAMPGRINEYVLGEGTTVAQALQTAELDATGFEVKVDGNIVTDLEGTVVTSATRMILLAKRVKGNAGEAVVTVKIGAMPGRINEFALAVGTPITEALAFAELDPTGFEIKVDGAVVTDTNSALVSADTRMILLAKKVKGNSKKVTK